MTSARGDFGALDELQALLDTWGGDFGRWPPAARSRLPGLEVLPGARALIDEARALDRVLATAADACVRVAPPAAAALADRIMAAHPAGGEVVPFPSRSTPSPAPPRTSRSEQNWPAAGLIAASLLVGVFIGGSINVGLVLQEIAEVAGLAVVSDPSLGDDLGEDETL